MYSTFEQTPTLSLYPEQCLPLQLDAGSELFCQQGPLFLHMTAPGLSETAGEHLTVLHTGQSWRAPHALWLRLQAPPAQRAQVQLQRSQKHTSRPAPKEQERLEEAPWQLPGLQWLARSLRRVRRAV
jgi:hypothetical protein